MPKRKLGVRVEPIKLQKFALDFEQEHATVTSLRLK